VANGLQPGLSAQYYTNAIDTRTRGIDVVVTYRWDLGDWGNVRFNGGYNHGNTVITHIKPNPPQLAALGQNFPLFGRAAQGNLTTSYPKTKVTLGANWQWDRWAVNLRTTRYGAFTTISDLVNGAVIPTNDRHYGSKLVTDLEVDFKVRPNITLVAGANNLFNEYPDKNGIYNPANGSGQFPGSSPFGFTGGSWYARVQYDF